MGRRWNDGPTAGSARGPSQRQQPRPALLDLVAERPLQHAAGPQLAAVVEVHLQLAALARSVDLCLEHPRRLAPVVEEARSMGLDIRMVRTAVDRGPAPARNLGVSLARGDIIAFTDSDCRPTPDWLAAARPHVVPESRRRWPR